PLNKGSGDGNLFRLFVEKNLSLLKQDGNLAYVLPSALMFAFKQRQWRWKFISSFCRKKSFSFKTRWKFSLCTS
ncbi:hypothetical protein KBJ80_10245, partial [Campylobacter jejuni]|uniref:Eco57I restriction-modification methylase domain-containing protein n=1 Tax=Campylobacter jejuni TaxID=197 RepID=UPI001EDBA0D1